MLRQFKVAFHPSQSVILRRFEQGTVVKTVGPGALRRPRRRAKRQATEQDTLYDSMTTKNNAFIIFSVPPAARGQGWRSAPSPTKQCQMREFEQAEVLDRLWGWQKLGALALSIPKVWIILAEVR
jgi:hypothetical protein